MTSVVLLLVTAVLASSVHGFPSEDELFVDVQSTGETFFASASNASAAAAIMHMNRYDMIAVNFCTLIKLMYTLAEQRSSQDAPALLGLMVEEVVEPSMSLLMAVMQLSGK